VNRADTLHRLKFLWDQVHQTAERIEHLPSDMPLHVHPQSLNYAEDLVRIKGEYNQLAREAVASGLLSAHDLQAEDLPQSFDRHG
jgi:hypothetical protein